MKKITTPKPSEYALYYEQYLSQLHSDCSVLDELKKQSKEIETTLLTLNEYQLNYTYAIGKWTIKDIIQHLIDCERVFQYRAMRFARNDPSAQPFFDENMYANEAQANKVPIKKIVKEYKTLRQSTITFFNNQSASTLRRMGLASNTMTSVRALAWIICAHELHHWNKIQELYLPKQ